MTLSSRFTRRRVAALAAALGLRHVLPARAQTPCNVQFVNGILQYSLDCTSIDAPGMNGMDIAPPSHLVSHQVAATGTTTSPQQVRQERLQKRRTRRDSKRGRKRDRKNKDTVKRQTRRAEALAAEITCEDFRDQKAALDHLAQFGDAGAVLDSDFDGLPCEHLAPVTCSQFSSQRDAAVWFHARGFHEGYDPFSLLEGDKADIVCKDSFS